MQKQIVVCANRAEWIAPLSQLTAPSVIVSPNPNPNIPSWLCEHAAPQEATEPDEVIACDICFDALQAGAYLVHDV
jgi:hypothetical protein